MKQFDRDHPDLAIFPDNNGPLREETKRKIYQQFRRGESAEALAKKFCCTKTSIYRIVGEVRAKRILELPLDYIPNDEFAEYGP
ncbi:MAG: Mor transcription activator family protein, partial [Myxococcota bacterium]